MVSLVRTKEEIEARRKRFDEDSEPSSFELFPVSIHFGDDEVEKLNLEGAQVGDEMMIMGKVRVTSVSMRDGIRAIEKDQSVGVDVIELEIADETSMQEIADTLFPENQE